MRRIRRLTAGSAACLLIACADSPVQLPPLRDSLAFRTAGSLVSSGRFAAAAAEYVRVRDSFAARGDTANRWFAQLWWAETMVRDGQPDSGAVGFARAESLAAGDARRLAWVGVMRSKLFERLGRLDTAIALGEQAVAAARRIGDSELSVWAYDALGTAFAMQGRYRESLAADSASLALRRATDMPVRVIAGGLNEVAISYRHLGRYDDARRALEESYRLARSAQDTLGMAVARANLSNVWDAVGDRHRAIAALGEALAYVEAIGHRRFMVASRNQIAAHFLETGNPDSAIGYATRSLDVARATRNRYGEVEALTVLGGATLAHGEAELGRRTLREALALAADAGLQSDRVDLYALLVQAEIARGDAAAALRAGDSAVAIATSLDDPALQFTALEALARAREAARRPDAASGYGAALDVLESIRGRLALGDLQLGVAAHRLSAYEGAVRTLLAAGRPREAFHVAERSRARLLLALMADRGLAPDDPIASLRQRLRDAHEARESVRHADVRAQLDREIATLGDSLVALEQARRVGTTSGAARYPGVLSPDTVAATLLTPGRALLAYFWGDSAVVGWWITRDSVRAVALGRAEALGPTIDFLRGALERPDDSVLWRAAGARAFRTFVAPLAPGPVRELVIIADGPLGRVPFESFVPDSTGEPWGARVRINYGPSASVLAAIARAPRPQWSRTMLAVGNPTGSGDTTLMVADVRADGLGALPFAESEARAIHRLAGGARADLLIGPRATLDRWLDRDPGRYRYLHFALHAVASDRHPEAGALLFGGRPLDLRAVRELRLEAELATLSACETGVGRWVRGEGIIGLQHAFLAAGARRVVVTLWRVADQSTALFMERFYSELLAGRPPADALAHVRTEWIRAGGDLAHPWRWAPFILIGPPGG